MEIEQRNVVLEPNPRGCRDVIIVVRRLVLFFEGTLEMARDTAWIVCFGSGTYIFLVRLRFLQRREHVL